MLVLMYSSFPGGLRGYMKLFPLVQRRLCVSIGPEKALCFYWSREGSVFLLVQRRRCLSIGPEETLYFHWSRGDSFTFLLVQRRLFYFSIGPEEALLLFHWSRWDSCRVLSCRHQWPHSFWLHGPSSPWDPGPGPGAALRPGSPQPPGGAHQGTPA